jgi:hypothetical protein
MKKFEYQLLRTDNGVFRGIEYEKLNNRLDYLGMQGWEVVSTVCLTSGGSTTSLLITLKRELPG